MGEIEKYNTEKSQLDWRKIKYNCLINIYKIQFI